MPYAVRTSAKLLLCADEQRARTLFNAPLTTPPDSMLAVRGHLVHLGRLCLRIRPGDFAWLHTFATADTNPDHNRNVRIGHRPYNIAWARRCSSPTLLIGTQCNQPLTTPSSPPFPPHPPPRTHPPFSPHHPSPASLRPCRLQVQPEYPPVRPHIPEADGPADRPSGHRARSGVVAARAGAPR